MANIKLKSRIQGLKENMRRLSDAELISTKNLVNKEYDRRFTAEINGKQAIGS